MAESSSNNSRSWNTRTNDRHKTEASHTTNGNALILGMENIQKLKDGRPCISTNNVRKCMVEQKPKKWQEKVLIKECVHNGGNNFAKWIQTVYEKY